MIGWAVGIGLALASPTTRDIDENRVVDAYNAGVDAWDRNDLPESLAWWVRVVQLSPRDLEARANLELARSKLLDGTPPAPSLSWINSRDWWWASLLVMAGAVVLRRRASRAASLLWVVGIGFWIVGWSWTVRPYAVLSTSAYVLPEPDVRAGRGEKWPLGTEAFVIEQSDEFVAVERVDGERAWLARADVIVVGP